jgi:membrane protein
LRDFVIQILKPVLYNILTHDQDMAKNLPPLPLLTQLKNYLQTRWQLFKYEAIDTGTSLAAAIVVDVLIVCLLSVTVLFFSIALVAVAAKMLHSWWAGSLVVAGLYVLAGMLVPVLRKPIQNHFIHYFIRKIHTHQQIRPTGQNPEKPMENNDTSKHSPQAATKPAAPVKFWSKAYFRELGKVIVATFSGFINDNGLKLSAALAYYTVFSLAPLLILVISIASIVFKQDALNNTLYPQIKGYIGAEAAAQVQNMVKSLQFSGKTGFALISGIVVLLLGASSIFVEIQDSLNMIWRVKAKPKRGWLKLLQNRFLSFSLILSLGFLLMTSLVINFAVNALSEKLAHFIPGVTHLFLEGVNVVVTLIVIATLFGIIFKFLPDVKIKWRDVRSGAIFTAIFFVIGQLLIGLYLTYSAQGSAYGAAGSLIVILVWIYYTSCILYIGAEFTQVYAEARGSVIEPAEFAVHVQQTEVEHEVSELPPQNPHLQNNLKRK